MKNAKKENTDCKVKIIPLGGHMIQKGYLENISLDTPNKRIMLAAFNKVAQKEQYETVTCPHCGGENVIRPGWASSCQYCGSKLI